MGAVYGGTGTRLKFDDTWEWDGAAWARLAQATAPALVGGAATDLGRGRLVALAGRSPGANGEAWLWDGRGWAQIVRPVMPLQAVEP